LVLRPPERAKELIERLEEHGALVTAIPLIRPESMRLVGSSAMAVQTVESYDWVVFTSGNTVRALLEIAGDQFFGTLRHGNVKVAAIGSATALALERLKVTVDLVPMRQSSRGLVEAMRQKMRGRVLLPQSDLAGEGLARELESAGFDVKPVTVYRTVPDPSEARRAVDLVGKQEVDILVFSSPSTISAMAGASSGRLSERLAGVGVVCMGRRTAAAARETGLEVGAVAGEPGTDGLVAGVLESNRRLSEREA
jgi:uroporphyrinogen III methyltransferase/synthase